MSQAALRPPSFWLDQPGEALTPRPGLEGDTTADVAIVGAGYTGLWTAYYLATHRPDLSLAMVESEVAGFGASGRNGGWCTPILTGIERWMARPGEQGERGRALQRAMFDAVDEVGRVARREDIACDYAKGGFLNFATNDAEVRRAGALLDAMRRLGFPEDDHRWLDARACEEKVRLEGVRGGLYSPHGAALQPAKLARGLADTVERMGVTLHECSPARAVRAGEVVTDRGRLRAGIVLLCTEGYTDSLEGMQRRLLPMHSTMIATGPLDEARWSEIGAADRVLFGDLRRILSYAQRTADDRIALGAGGFYRYGSGIERHLPAEGSCYALAERVLHALFPMLRDVAITHRWGGAFGVTRDWKPFVRFDPATGLGGAGGYAGNGVAASNLAGRTLADLVAGRETERATHPWVAHRSPRWEPEPLRWLAVRSLLAIGSGADEAEERGRPARLRAAIFDGLAGH